MIPILVQDISTSFPHFRKGPLVTQGNVVDHKSLSTKMFVHSVVLSLLIFVAGISAFRFPSPFLRSSILILNDVPPRLSPFGGGELKSNENEVVNEKTDHIEQSGLLLADASDWGIKTALAEEHIALGNFDEAVKLARGIGNTYPPSLLSIPTMPTPPCNHQNAPLNLQCTHTHFHSLLIHPINNMLCLSLIPFSQRPWPLLIM